MRSLLILAVFVALAGGCGAPSPATSPAAELSAPAPALPPPPPSASSASSADAPAAPASAAPEPPPPVASAAAPAASARPADVLLDSKLPPRMVSAGGSYNLLVNDTKNITRTDALSAVEKSSKDVDRCFGDIFKAGGKKGKIAFAVVVELSGKVRSATVQGDELNDKKLPKCLEGALKKIEWPRPADKGGSSLVIEWFVQS